VNGEDSSGECEREEAKTRPGGGEKEIKK